MLNKSTILCLAHSLTRLDSKIEEVVRSTKTAGCFRYIPYPTFCFVHLMELVSFIRNKLTPKLPAERRWSFLDVGCGWGTKLLIAEHYFFEPHGIEINPSYVNKAKSLGLEEQVKKANALTFRGYKNYQVIYFYQPFRDLVLQEQLEQRIFRFANENALVIQISLRCLFVPPKEDWFAIGPVKHHGGNIWIKSGKKDIRNIAAEAYKNFHKKFWQGFYSRW